MKIKGPKARLRIREIQPQRGKAYPVTLINGVKVFLPAGHVDFQVDDYDGRVAVIPQWLMAKIKDNIRVKPSGETETTC